MKASWQEFLQQDAGAVIEHGRVQHFGNPERELRVINAGSIITDLSQRGLIRIAGDDSETFLQGQLTNDVRAVDVGHSQITGYCSPKGRLLASFRLLRHQDAYYISVAQDVLAATLKRLRMFVLRSKVTIDDVSDGLVYLGFAGPKATEQLGNVIGELPQQDNAVSHTNDVTVIRVPGLVPRFEILAPLESAKKIWQALDVHGAPVGTHAWELMDIQAGIPHIHTQTVDAFVPQMANFHAINAVSFQKGCYTGQEIVARTHYLGRLKRRLYLARVATDQLPEPGTPLFASGSESGQGTGKVVEAQHYPDGGIELLAVVEIASAEGDSVHLGEVTGPVLNFQSLPYHVNIDGAGKKG